MSDFEALVQSCVQQGVSDMHITGGHPVVLRKDGTVAPQRKIVLRHGEVDELARSLMTRQQARTLRRQWSVDFAISVAGTRLRINIFATTRGLSLAVRFLPGEAPEIEMLNLHPSLAEFCRAPSGLVLVCGATGSGKTTTIAALLGEINRNRAAHVVTLEDPVEYRFRSVKSFIEQRELGSSFQSFEQGLVDVLRQAPDVIFVGELRRAEIIRLTLDAAESGHLVFATLHANSVEEALYRMLNAFPADAQEFARSQLSSALCGVVVQRLALRQELGFRVPDLAVLRAGKAVRSIIRENRLSQLENTMELGREAGMFTFGTYAEEMQARRKAYVHPSRTLRPGQEAAREALYESPLIDPLATVHPALDGSGAPGAPSGLEAGAAPAALTLENDDALSEVIRQITDRGPQPGE